MSQPDTKPAPVSTEISPADYAFLQRHIYRESGIVIDANKEYLLMARLMPIIRRQSLGTIADLCALLRAAGARVLKQEVVEAMTTNETLFFRDVGPFEALRSHLLPPVLAQRAPGKVRFWSAAASSGQEAYSLVMLLLEMGLTGHDFEILATDLAESVLDRARAGRYMQIEVNRGLPATHLIKYFTRQGLDWQIQDQLRKLVKFEKFDLRHSMSSLGPFDFVFCRNVLIYFDVETKRKILSQIRTTLAPGGYLSLGSAETTLNLDESFTRCTAVPVPFYQLAT